MRANMGWSRKRRRALRKLAVALRASIGRIRAGRADDARLRPSACWPTMAY
jgi:hypothetical protein